MRRQRSAAVKPQSWTFKGPRNCARPAAGRCLAAVIVAMMVFAGSVRAQDVPLPLPDQVAVPTAEGGAPAEAPVNLDLEEDRGAEEGEAERAQQAGEGRLNYSILQLIQFAGYIGYLIIILSFVALSLVIEYLLSLRKKVLVPEADVSRIRQLVANGALQDLVTSASGKSSFIVQVVGRGVAEADRGYDAVVKAMEDKADELTGTLLRKIEHLNIIANIAPMLGLLGTVLGMVEAFNQISVSIGGVDPRKLAAGIFQALMTTVMGLIVAIPAIYIFGLFRNRVDALVAEAAIVAEELVEPLKPRGASEREVAQAVGGRGSS